MNYNFIKLHISSVDEVYVSIEKVLTMIPVKDGTLLRFAVPDFTKENGVLSTKLYKITVSESIDEIIEMCKNMG